MKHTPGPLMAVGNFLGTDEEDSQTIGYTDDHRNRHRRNSDGQIANACLLAAAYSSYDKHCGDRAIECAEGDLLGESLKVLEAFLPYLSTETEMLDYASLNEGQASHWNVLSIQAREVIAMWKGGS